MEFETRIYDGVEFIVRFDGAHKNVDADLFSPVEFEDAGHGEHVIVRKQLKLRKQSATNQDAIAAVLRDSWDTLTAISARAQMPRESVRWALRTMVRRGVVESMTTPMIHLGKCVVVYRRAHHE